MLKKFMSDSKEKNKLKILDNWSILKEKKNKIVFKFSIAIMKLNFFVFIENQKVYKLFGVYCNHVSCIRIEEKFYKKSFHIKV
jgi:hypothetical protein